MLFWALLAFRQTTVRKVDGWRKPLNKTPSDQSVNLVRLEIGQINSNTNRDGTELFRCGQLYVGMTVRKSFGKTLGNF
jgi:hypothetical protein